ncbi:MAG: leucine-rich repeat domain-containing protein [Clostridia bacterium]|nr:leucine-rich repeat domain-containing protein [Clostridia bacterium]
MKKKLLIIILSILSVCLLMFTFAACNNNNSGESSPDEDIEYSQNLAYTISEDGTYYIVRGLGLCSDKDIVISPTYKSLPVLEIADNAFENESITSVSFPKNVSVIGEKAFSECQNLTQITFGEDITTIESHAFYKCPKLALIDFGNNPLTISQYAFYLCENLTSIDLGSTVSIGSYAFCGCDKLTSVKINENITYISDSAFEGCGNLVYNTYGNCTYLGNDTCKYIALFEATKSLTSCIVQNGTRLILAEAFRNCTSLKNITLPDSIIDIGYSAFRNCNSLKSIEIPIKVVDIGDYAFHGCVSLTNIDFNAKNCSNLPTEVFADAGINGAGIYVKIGANVQQIPANLFAGNPYNPLFTTTSPKVVNIEFDNNSKCTNICSGAFCNLTELTSLKLPNSITTLGEGAFRDCYNLITVTLGTNVKDIASTTFENCYKLIEVCNNSNFLNISASSKDNGYIGYYARNIYKSPENSKLNYNENGCVTYGDGQTLILVTYRGNSTNVNIPDGVTEINNYAFYCTRVETVNIPSTVSKIGSYAFYYSSLTYIKIPSSVNSIGSYVFRGCSSLMGIEFEDRYSWYHTTSKEDWFAKTGGTYIVPYSYPDVNVSSFTDDRLYYYHYWYKLDE